jgi:hypothetical protein
VVNAHGTQHLLTLGRIGHTVARCKNPPAEDANSGGWNSGAAAGDGAASGWDANGSGDAAVTTGSWAEDTEGAGWGDSGAGGW